MIQPGNVAQNAVVVNSVRISGMGTPATSR